MKYRPHFVFILGMHRSGTSCLAGSLERCGLYLGMASRRALRDPQCNFLYEHEGACLIHDQILSFNGGSWRQPPSRTVVSPEQKQALKKLAVQLAKHTPCGLKDPRLLSLLDTWTEIVASYTLVGTFRHPAAVAKSLARRHPMPENEAHHLWLELNTTLIRWHRAHPFPIIEFDLSDAQAYCKTVAVLALTLGLSPDMEQLHQFVRPRLDHHASTKEPVPPLCQEAYSYLQQHRYRPAISDDELEAQILAAQRDYTGWRWSPDRLRQTLRPIKRFLTPALIEGGRRWLRRLDTMR